MSLAYRKALEGTVLPVLFEETEGEYYTGHAPNYVKFYVRGAELHNTIRQVRVVSAYRDGVLGELL